MKNWLDPIEIIEIHLVILGGTPVGSSKKIERVPEERQRSVMTGTYLVQISPSDPGPSLGIQTVTVHTVVNFELVGIDPAIKQEP